MRYNKLSREEFYSRLQSKTFYLYYEFEDVVLRVQNDGKTFVKFKGQSEFEAKPESGIVTEAFLNPCEISESDYNSY